MKYASLDKMIAIVAVAFEGDFDKGDKPYILHLMRVANKMPKNDYKAQMVAWGHDLMKDKPEWTPQRLLNEGFHPKVVNSLDLMNHRKCVSYDTYVRMLALDYHASMAKMGDLEDNMDPIRLKTDENGDLREKDLTRIVKYNKAYSYLMKHAKCLER